MTGANLTGLKFKKLRAILLANTSALALSACGGGGTSDADDGGVADQVAENLGTLFGTNEADSVPGTMGADRIEALDGGDYILALSGDDVVYGGAGDDTIWADLGDDVVYGGEGNDTIYPGEGDDKSYGGAGDDVIYLSSGNDQEDGGEGNDTLKIASNHSGIATTIDLLLGQYYFTAQGSSAFFNLSGMENVDSQAGASLTILDTPEVNIITTGSGDDVVKSVGGNDIISTGGGDDRVELATGFIYDVKLGSGDDEVVLGLTYSNIDGGSGTDAITVRELNGITDFYADLSTGFYFFKGVATSQDGFDTLLANFETVTVEGQVNAELIGGNAAETLTADAGDDVISGGSGADTITAGAGDDTVTGGAGVDAISLGDGADTIVLGASATDLVAYQGADTTAANIESVSDFTVADDTIQISDAMTFANLTMAAGVTSATVTHGAAPLAAGSADITALTAAMETSATGTASTAAAGGLQAYVFETAAGTGAFDGKTFLVFNDDTAAIAATDVIIDITGVTGTLTSADFVIA